MEFIKCDDDIKYKVYISFNSIFIRNHSIHKDKILAIEKRSIRVYLTESSILDKEICLKSLLIRGIIGIISIMSEDYLLLITEQELVATINKNNIYKIKDLEFICLSSSNETSESESRKYIKGIKSYILSGFYYSYSYDLTNNLEKQSQTNENDIFFSSNKQFLWNSNLIYNFLPLKDSDSLTDWLVPVICGYVGSFSITLFDNYFTFILLSRRSIFRAGTRYMTRGIDDDGNVGNYIETEQIIIFQNKVFTYLQLRGSSPIFFEQNELMGQTTVLRTPEMTCSAFSKHFDQILSYYDKVKCINLLNKKSSELCISETYENVVKLMKDKFRDSLEYEHFDYNKQTKDGFILVDNFIEKIEGNFPITFSSICDINKNLLNKQLTVIRTNCLDSLDRTNLIQTRIGWIALKKILGSLKITQEYTFIFNQNFLNPSITHVLMEKFKTLWIKNGDSISNQYSGTKSTSSFVAKNGNSGFLGMFNKAKLATQRFIEGTVNDGMKQKCIDLIIQKKLSKNLSFNSSLILKKEYTLKLHIVSWCLSGREIPEDLDLSELFCLSNSVCDIYICGFQKIIDFNTKNLFFTSNKEAINKIRIKLSNTLNFKEDFVLLKEIELVGLYLLIFVKRAIKDNFSNIDYSVGKLGLLGHLGNKGYLLLRFEYNNNTFAVCCCHLNGNNSNSNMIKRISVIKNIMVTSIGKYNDLFHNYDNAFLFGNMNFHLIDNDSNNSYSFNDENLILKSLSNDEFLKEKEHNMGLLDVVEEGTISFKPTFKYLIDKDELVSKKNKICWADRIFWIKNKKIILKEYNSVNYVLSQHKPVYAQFEISEKSYTDN